MGTPEFAVGVLSSLLAKEYKVVAVVTAPDKPAGRGRKLNESAVKKFALANDLPLLQPKNLKNQLFIDQLKQFKADVQVVVAFRMLPKVVWQMPPRGTLNLHASLLPNYRGAAPINWVLINGEEKTGTTTFFIDDKIDTGAIILQNELLINPDDNAGSLHDKLMHLGSDLVLETLFKISQGPVATVEQADIYKSKKEIAFKTAPKLNKENCKINWQQDTETVYNLIRGLSPFPLAWTTIVNNDQKIEAKIYAASKEIITHHLPLGQVVFTKKELKVAVRGGFIIIDALKLAGKRKMSAQDLLNGFQFVQGAFMC